MGPRSFRGLISGLMLSGVKNRPEVMLYHHSPDLLQVLLLCSAQTADCAMNVVVAAVFAQHSGRVVVVLLVVCDVTSVLKLFRCSVRSELPSGLGFLSLARSLL